MRFDGLSRATAVPVWDSRRRGQLRDASQKMGGEPPVWMQVFPYPAYDCTIDGERRTLVTDDESQRSIVEVWAAKGNDLFIDFEHATTAEGVYYAPAAGRIVEVVAGGRLGLLARCEWTEEAAADIRAGRYYYDSPTFLFSEEDSRIYVLAGIALTNYPGSFNRPYITDHASTNYEALLATAKASAQKSTITRPRRLVCAAAKSKGGKMKLTFQQVMQKVADNVQALKLGAQKLTDSVMNNIRYAFDLPVTTTGNELRTFLMALHDNVEANDSPIFIVDEAQKDKVKTLGDLLKLGQQAAPVYDLRPLRVALGAADDASLEALALAVLEQKAKTVPIERYRELEQKLAAAQTTTVAERVNLLIAKNKAKITPDREAEIRRLVEADGFDLAEKFVGLLPELDLASQSAGTAPAPKPATQSAPAATVRAESEAKRLRTLAIQKERGVDYATASRIRLEEERGAAAE